jgi:hypothetical protein
MLCCAVPCRAVLCCAGVLRPLHTARTLPACLVHAFTGNEAELEAYRGMDFYIGVTGHLLRKKNPMVEWLPKWVPLSRLLIETDSPYMGACSAPLMHNIIYPTACKPASPQPCATRAAAAVVERKQLCRMNVLCRTKKHSHALLCPAFARAVSLRVCALVVIVCAVSLSVCALSVGVCVCACCVSRRVQGLPQDRACRQQRKGNISKRPRLAANGARGSGQSLW